MKHILAVIILYHMFCPHQIIIAESHDYRSGRYPGFTCFEYVMAPKDCLEGISVPSEWGAHPKFFIGWAGANPEASAIYV